VPALVDATAPTEANPAVPDVVAPPPPRPPARFLGVPVGVAITAALGGAAVTLGVLIAGLGGGSAPAPARVVAPVVPAPPRTGNLTVAVHPNDVSILVDDMPPHAGSPYTIEVTPGEHRIEIRRDGYETWMTSVDVKAGVIQTVQAALVEDTAMAAPSVATLALDSTPRGLEVILDGSPLEYPTPIRMGVAPGKHELVVRQRGVVIWSTTFVAKANQSHRFHAAAPVKRGDVDAAPEPPALEETPDAALPREHDAATRGHDAAPVARPDAAPAVVPPTEPAPDARPRTPPPPPPPPPLMTP